MYQPKNVTELTIMINRIPNGTGTVRYKGGELTSGAIKTKLLAIAPKVFRYHELLIKARGGVGNKKSLDRFVGIVNDANMDEATKKYDSEVAKLTVEVEHLMNNGIPEELAAQLHDAKNRIATIKKMEEVINGLGLKLNLQMQRVETRAREMSEAVKRSAAETKDQSLRGALKMAADKLEEDVKEIKDLTETLTDYCGLQVALNALFV